MATKQPKTIVVSPQSAWPFPTLDLEKKPKKTAVKKTAKKAVKTAKIPKARSSPILEPQAAWPFPVKSKL